jgi:hypothetical protein
MEALARHVNSATDANEARTSVGLSVGLLVGFVGLWGVFVPFCSLPAFGENG